MSSISVTVAILLWLDLLGQSKVHMLKEVTLTFLNCLTHCLQQHIFRRSCELIALLDWTLKETIFYVTRWHWSQYADFAISRFNLRRFSNAAISAMVDALTWDTVTYVPSGSCFIRRYRHAPSGCCMVRQVESFYTLAICLRAGLVHWRRTGLFPISLCGILADNTKLGIYPDVDNNFAQTLDSSSRRYGFQLKGDSLEEKAPLKRPGEAFDLLGYEIKGGRAYSSPSRILGAWLQAERHPVLTGWDEYQASRACGYSQVLQGLNPDMHSFFEKVIVEYGRGKQLPRFNDNEFVPVISARTPGEQDILRAEMYAIAIIIVQAKYGVIHSDCQVAIHHFSCMMEASHPSQFMSLDHFDILYWVWKTGAYHRVTFQKVKAHQHIEDIPDLLDKYWCIGNKLADEGAQNAACHLGPDFAEELQHNKQMVLKHRTLLKQVFHLHLELRSLRMQALKTDNSSGGQALTTQAICDALSNWKIEHPLPFAPQYDLQFLNSCLWGHDVALKTVHWLEQLVWAQDDSQPLHKSTGISWIELAICWMIFNRMLLPVKRACVTGHCVVIPANLGQAQEHKVTLSGLGTNMKYVFDNLAALIPQQLTPPTVKKKVGSLYQLGYKQFTQGWSKRPEVPAQGQMVTLLYGHFTGQNFQNLDWVPYIETDQSVDIVLGDWNIRQKAARKFMPQVRTLRKNLAGG